MKKNWFGRKRDRWYIGTAGGLLVAAGILQLAARQAEGFGQWYVTRIYPIIVAVFGRVFGFIPFSVGEVLLYLLIVGFLIYGIRHIKEWGRILGRALFTVSLLLFLYTVNCGINYYGRPFSSYLDIEVRASSEEELEELCWYLTDKVNKTLDNTTYHNEWRETARNAMEGLGEIYPELGGYYPSPKPVAASEILSVQQLSGIYLPFTLEANFNRSMVAYNIPHTMCHELSHLKGFMREDEANFIGYLACIQSDNKAFQYSGHLLGWIYATNALAKVDMEQYEQMYRSLKPDVIMHLNENSEFWDQYEGVVAEASNKINDTYLKFNDQQDGVQSYGRVVDLMLAYYRRADGFD